MPLLEVIQTRQISASIRLTDTTATQVDQYAAFIHASAETALASRSAISIGTPFGVPKKAYAGVGRSDQDDRVLPLV